MQTAGGREQATPTELHNYWTQVHVREKLAHLVSFLQGVRARGGAKVMVFMLTCCTVDYLAKLLPRLDECRYTPRVGCWLRVVLARLLRDVR